MPLDRPAIDSVTENGPEMVVGFTTAFVPGGTIADNPSRIFKLEHLKQLTTVSYLPTANDVKLTIITVYEIITRDLSFREEEY